ncbi:permease prefix domain 1-containing protein [Plantactinospora siamensis]|uniref:Permease prefix domain 1-containing protein n=1 Tax=Plantactinospora siamensis TaxID=555372 RepID=A0ABV6NWR8_9ACTN
MPVREMSLIDDYVHSLRGRLRGPARLKDDLLTEVRDGLTDAAEAHLDAGRSPVEAQRYALREFGPVRRIAGAYQAEIAARSARTLALRTVGMAAVLLAGGDLVWRGSPWTGTAPPSGYHLISRGTNWIWLATAVLALVCVGALSRAARRPSGGPAWLARAAGFGLAAALAVTVVFGMVLWIWSLLLWPAALSWPPMLIGMALLSAGYAWLAGGVRSCLLATRQVLSHGTLPSVTRPEATMSETAMPASRDYDCQA